MLGMGGLHAPIANLAPGGLGPAAQFRARIAGFTNPKKQAARRRFVPFIVDPQGLTQQEWADAFVYAMAHAIPLPQLEQDFDLWAAQIAQEPQLQVFQLPVIAQSWEEWADGVNSSLETVAAQ